MEWKRPLVLGEIPSPRSYHTLSAVEGKLYLFGGFSKATATALSDMYMLDTRREKLEWKKVTWEGNGPVERYEHTASVLDQHIYIFGGGNSRGWLNDLVIYDTVNSKWLNSVPEGSKPQKRLSHTAVVMGDKIIIFGGYNIAKKRLNDVHVLQTCIKEGTRYIVAWVQPTLSGTLPVARAAASAGCVDNSIVLFGGCSKTNERLNDTFVIDHNSLECYKVKNAKNLAPEARSYHYCEVIGRRVFIISGFDGATVFDDVWYLDLDFVAMQEAPEILPDRLSDDYKSLVNQEKYSDIVFTLDDGTKVFAHRLILTCRSIHFKAMLESGMAESGKTEIHLNEVERKPFLYLLQEIYSGDVELEPWNVVEIYKIAHAFGEKKLQLKCEQYLQERIDLENVCDVLILADIYYAKYLRKAALNFILIQFPFVSQRESYKTLSNDLKREIESVIKYNTSIQKPTRQ